MTTRAPKRDFSATHHARPRANQKMGRAVRNFRHKCRRPLRAACSLDESRSKSCLQLRKSQPCCDRTQQYSVTALTDSSGNVTERYAYSAYGTPTIADGNGALLTSSADNNRYTYTGREWDEILGLYHFRARLYDSYSGRFCSKDPLENLRTILNLYAGMFASSSALDPGGNELVWPWNENAEWWFPFDNNTIFPVVRKPKIPVDLQAILDFLCEWGQSNVSTCFCCLIEAGDITAAFLSAHLGVPIKYADKLLNVLDCLRDGVDYFSSICAMRGIRPGPMWPWPTIGANAATSCAINLFDLASDYRFKNGRRVNYDQLFLKFEIAQYIAMQRLLAAGGCNPCGPACRAVVTGDFK